MNDQATGLRNIVNKKLQDNNTRIIAIASGKGGVGKSNIAVNLGLALRELGERVLLIDADLGMANLDILLGVTPQYNLTHILKGKCEFKEAVVTASSGLNILPGTSGDEDLVNISFQEVIRLLEVSSQMEEEYDIIIIDIGAGIHRSVINFIMAADEALIVLTPEPTAIMDAYSLIKILVNHSYKNRLDILINKVDSDSEGNRIAKRMTNVIKEYLDLEINLIGFIPYDRHIKKSVKRQNAVLDLYPNSRASAALKQVAMKLVDKRQEKSSRGMKGFIYRIIGMFNRD